MKNMSCNLDRSNFVTFLVILLSFLALPLPVQSCRLNQNVLAQATGMNQRVQSETNQLNLPDREGADKLSFNRAIPQSATSNPPSVNSNPSIPQSAIQNLSFTSIGDPQSKAEVLRKIAKLQMPFIANEGQTDEKVAFYANTFGGAVFVTKDGEIVYSLPEGRGRDVPDGASQEAGCRGAEAVGGKKVETTPVGRLRKPEEAGGVDAEGQGGKVGRQDAGHQMQEERIANSDSGVLSANYHANTKPEGHTKSPLLGGDLGVGEPLPETCPRLRSGDPQSPMRGVALVEHLVGGKINEIKGGAQSVTTVSYFKGNDPSKWKSNISTYEVVDMGEVYKGIDLRLKAYGNNVEKVFCIKPGADPEQINIRLSGIQPSENPPPLSSSLRGTGGCPPLAGAGGGLGARGLWVNEHGELVAETELGPVKFTKPVAYQEIDGKRVEVEVAYQIENCKLQNAEQGITHPLPLSRGECKSPLSGGKYKSPLLGGDSGVGLVKSVLSFVEGRSAPNRTGLNLRAGSGLQPEPLNLLNTGVCAIDTISKNINTGVQVANLNPQETSGKRQMSSREKGMGRTRAYLASNFQSPTSNPKLVPDSDLSPAQSGDRGSVIQNLSSTSIGDPSSVTRHSSHSMYGFIVASYDRTKDLIIDPLLASTFLGGSGYYGDYGTSLTLDTSGNVYVTGGTLSTDFPTTSGAYDTSYNGGFIGGGWHTDGGDVFVSKLNSGLTSLLASTYLGGSMGETGTSLALYFFNKLSDDERGL